MLPRLSFVAIQKFCYRGNVTSHFSLLSSLLGLEGLKTRCMQTCDVKEKRTRIPRIIRTAKASGFRLFFYELCLLFFLLARPSIETESFWKGNLAYTRATKCFSVTRMARLELFQLKPILMHLLIQSLEILVF